MTSSYSKIEDRIRNALEHIDALKNPNIAATARQFDIPEHRLRYRYKFGASRIECGRHNKKLLDTQELAVLHWLNRLDEFGINARPSMVAGVANYILSQSLDTPSTVGGKWI
jgi:hypothetical protein